MPVAAHGVNGLPPGRADHLSGPAGRGLRQSRQPLPYGYSLARPIIEDFRGGSGLAGDFWVLWCTKITPEPQSTRIFRRCPSHWAHAHRPPEDSRPGRPGGGLGPSGTQRAVRESSSSSARPGVCYLAVLGACSLATATDGRTDLPPGGRREAAPLGEARAIRSTTSREASGPARCPRTSPAAVCDAILLGRHVQDRLAVDSPATQCPGCIGESV